MNPMRLRVDYRFLLVIAFWFTLCETAPKRGYSQTDEKHPVILVPGLGGSRVEYREKNSRITKTKPLWLNLIKMFRIDDLLHVFKLQYDETTHTTTDQPNVEVVIPGWGDTDSIAHLDGTQHFVGNYFGAIVDDLVKDPFFKPNTSLRGAPYDFRRTLNENILFIQKFKKLIEETYDLNGGRRVLIVGHSLGTIYSLEFLEAQTVQWKKKYIHAFVSVSGPFGGAAKASISIASGEVFSLPFPDPRKMRTLWRTFPTIASLTPDERLWNTSEALISTPTRNYTVKDLKDLFEDVGYPQGYDMWLNNPKNFDYFKGPTGVDNVYCIYGSGVATPEKAVYWPASWFIKPFPIQLPTILYGDGDGSVNLRSLQVCQGWPNVIQINLPGVSHVPTLQDKRVVELIGRISGAKPEK